MAAGVVHRCVALLCFTTDSICLMDVRALFIADGNKSLLFRLHFLSFHLFFVRLNKLTKKNEEKRSETPYDFTQEIGFLCMCYFAFCEGDCVWLFVFNGCRLIPSCSSYSLEQKRQAVAS